MDELINSISDAYEKYINAADAVLDAYHFTGGRQTEATNRALENLTEQKQQLVSACNNAEGSIHAMIQRVGELEVPPHRDRGPLAGHEELVPCAKAPYALQLVMQNFDELLQFDDLSCQNAGGGTNAAEVAPIRPANAERRQPNAPDGGDSGTHVTGDGNIAESLVLSSIDLNRAKQTQSTPARLNHTRLLSELDPKKTA